MNIFSIWFIGKSRDGFPQLSVAQIIGIYTGMVVGFGVMLFVSALIVPFQSVKNTEALATEIVNHYETAESRWVTRSSKIFAAICCIGRVRE